MKTRYLKSAIRRWTARGRRPAAKSLVVCPVGRAGKEFIRRTVERFGHDSFDFLLLVYDGTPFEEDCFADCRIVHDELPLLSRLKKHVTPALCRAYEYVLIWMDDLDVLDFDPQNYLRILRTHGIEVGHPALSPDSVISHPIMERRDTALGRYTDFVELLACTFRGELWERFWRLIEPGRNPWGWGYDEVAYSVCPFRKMAIIDCEVIRHTRKGAYHDTVQADHQETLRRYADFFRPRKKALCEITDDPWHESVVVPLWLHLRLAFARSCTLPGVPHLRRLLRACLDRRARQKQGETAAPAPLVARKPAPLSALDVPSFPREPLHPWLKQNRQYLGNLTAMRRYAAEISGVDDGVGRVLETLDRLGLGDNTLVIFTADQGLCGGHHGMWGMSDHSRPLHTYDETCHVPLIFRHPNAIPAGRQSDLMVSNYDLLPTVLNHLGLPEKVPDRPRGPGRDYAPVLRGRTLEWDNVIFFEFENTRMVRTPEWKYTRRFPDGPDELYDLRNDAGERVNLVDRAEHAETRRQLAARLEAFFARYADPKYDLWHGGGSKTLLLTSNQPALPRTPISRPPLDPPQIRSHPVHVNHKSRSLDAMSEGRAE